MKSGTVFRWNKFPFPKFGDEIKPRWFIYLGDTGLLSTPVIAHLCTTTTSLVDFGPGGKRAKHQHLFIKKKQFPFFDEDCILDFDEEPYAEWKSNLEGNPDIEIKGELGRDTLKSIYSGIMRSDYYSKKIILDIYSSLNKIGITGLTKP